MKTYREKIVEVQAVQWCGQNSGEVDKLCGNTSMGNPRSWATPAEGLMVRTIDGFVKVPISSYVVKCNKGYKIPQLYIYTESEFESKYEEVE